MPRFTRWFHLLLAFSRPCFPIPNIAPWDVFKPYIWMSRVDFHRDWVSLSEIILYENLKYEIILYTGNHTIWKMLWGKKLCSFVLYIWKYIWGDEYPFFTIPWRSFLKTKCLLFQPSKVQRQVFGETRCMEEKSLKLLVFTASLVDSVIQTDL